MVAWPLPIGVTVTVPLKGPAVAGNWPGLTVTEILPVGGFPVNCPFPGLLTVNQGLPSFVACETEKAVILGLLLWIITDCVDATVLPGANE